MNLQAGGRACRWGNYVNLQAGAGLVGGATTHLQVGACSCCYVPYMHVCMCGC